MAKLEVGWVVIFLLALKCGNKQGHVAQTRMHGFINTSEKLQCSITCLAHRVFLTYVTRKAFALQAADCETDLFKICFMVVIIPQIYDSYEMASNKESIQEKICRKNQKQACVTTY